MLFKLLLTVLQFLFLTAFCLVKNVRFKIRAHLASFVIPVGLQSSLLWKIAFISYIISLSQFLLEVVIVLKRL